MSRASERDADVKALTEQLLSTQQELTALKAKAGDVAKLSADCDAWKQRSEDLKSQLAAAEKQLSILETSEAAMKQQARELAAQNSKLENSLALAREQLVTLQGLTSTQREQLESIERSTSGVHGKLETQGEQIKDLQSKLRDLQEVRGVTNPWQLDD